MTTKAKPDVEAGSVWLMRDGHVVRITDARNILHGCAKMGYTTKHHINVSHFADATCIYRPSDGGPVVLGEGEAFYSEAQEPGGSVMGLKRDGEYEYADGAFERIQGQRGRLVWIPEAE